MFETTNQVFYLQVNQILRRLEVRVFRPSHFIGSPDFAINSCNLVEFLHTLSGKFFIKLLDDAIKNAHNHQTSPQQTRMDFAEFQVKGVEGSFQLGDLSDLKRYQDTPEILIWRICLH